MPGSGTFGHSPNRYRTKLHAQHGEHGMLACTAVQASSIGDAGCLNILVMLLN